VNREGDRTQEPVTDFQLKEVIVGHPEGPWTDMRYRDSIRWPLSPTGNLANSARWLFPGAGERFLYFSGARFDSCRIVRATPSAQAAVARQPRRLRGARTTYRGCGDGSSSRGIYGGSRDYVEGAR
jgi:hypothetical protein